MTTRAGCNVVLWCSLLLALGCGDDKLTHATMGILDVTVINAGTAASIDLTLRCDAADSRDAHQLVNSAQTLIEEADLTPGTCAARIVSRDSSNNALSSVWMSDLLITGGHTTAITVDLSTGVIPPPTELCGPDGATDPTQLLICSQCANGIEVAATDDARCANITCGDYFTYALRGSAGNGWSCVKDYLEDITTDRCDSLGLCLAQSEATCQAHGTKMESVVSTVDATDVCHFIGGCADQTPPAIDNEPDGTTCDTQKWCQSGACVCKPACDGKVCGDDGCGGKCGDCKVAEQCTAGACVCKPDCTGKVCGDDGCGGKCGDCKADETCTAGACVADKPDTGCADGTREGFQSLTGFPTIAACSGGWDQPGITSTTAPTCNRASGNDGTNKEGTGCSAADLCAAGWHVCLGKTEVAAKAGAADACNTEWPTENEDTGVLFAVVQHSTQNTICDDTSTVYNDVFGCGSMGRSITPASNSCGVLNRGLGATADNSCGWNQAEGPNGPWRCVGKSTNEGGDVTKNGCPPNGTCAPGIANWDKGGVLCCKD
jgi:hypothetical protein